MRPPIRRLAVEFNLTEHCNLRCEGCDHASALLPRKLADLGSFERDMRALAPALHVKQLKLVGGEPLLHPRLRDFLEVGRASGIADRLIVITNGVLLHRLDPEVLRFVDVLQVSLYPGVELRGDLSALRRRASESGCKLRLKPVASFRKTLLQRRHTDESLVRAVYWSCRMAHRWSCHTVHEGHYYKCAPAALLARRLATAGEVVDVREEDRVRLHDNPNLRADLERYLADEEPLSACRWCLGTSGRSLPHRQLAGEALRTAPLGQNPDRPRPLTRPSITLWRNEVALRLKRRPRHRGGS